MESVAANASKEERQKAQKVREAARAVKHEDDSPPPTDTPAVNQGSKACTHFVALPEKYDGSCETLDSSIYGEWDPS